MKFPLEFHLIVDEYDDDDDMLVHLTIFVYWNGIPLKKYENKNNI